MSLLVYRSAEIADFSVRRCRFAIVEGWYDGLQVRGEDIIIPGKSGRDGESRVDDIRVIRLHGHVIGSSPANWNAVRSTLETVFDPGAAAANLVAHAPYMGLASGTRTISARVESVRTVDLVQTYITEYDVILHAIGSPPDWTEDLGGS